MLLHEGVKISVTFPCLKILSFQQGKRNDHLQQALLVVDPILHTIESGDSLEKLSCGRLAEIWLVRSCPNQIFIEQSASPFMYLLERMATLRLKRRDFCPTCGIARHR